MQLGGIVIILACLSNLLLAHAGYKITDVEREGNQYIVLTMELKEADPKALPHVKAVVTLETETRVHIKIVDATYARWEVPEELLPTPPYSPITTDEMKYKFSFAEGDASMNVTRKSDGVVVLTLSELQFWEQWIKVSASVAPTPALYGLGEHNVPLLLDSNDHSYTMWSADCGGTPDDQNIYGNHPFYMENRQGNWHGVFLKNSNGMDVIVSKGKVTYNVIGGIFDFYVFIGPHALDVISQYQEIIGTPVMPPYWALGYHQCRWGYPSLEFTKEVVRNYSEAGIPLDTIWSDIDYMSEYEDFSFDAVAYPEAQVKEWVEKELHEQRHMHYVVIVDPGIHIRAGYESYETGLKDKIFVTTEDGTTPYAGSVWPGPTHYPDFLNPNTNQYWQKQIDTFLKKVPIDGLWIDMNEASNFQKGGTKNPKYISANMPYVINNWNKKADLDDKTLAMDAQYHDASGHSVDEYNMHNIYGFSESIATRKALEAITGKRSFVLTRSSFAGTGHHVSHWLGDNYSTYKSMMQSIAGVLQSNIMGIPMVGGDACGFIGDTDEELCARWTALSAFTPFARNHHEKGSPVFQEPYRWPTVAAVARKTLKARYSLLPYLYTLFASAHLRSTLVVQPLSFLYSNDPETMPIDQQFMLGDCLLVSPVLTKNATSVRAYIPPSDQWYDFWTLKRVFASGWTILDAPVDYIPVHIRGGCVVPQQEPKLTTTDTKTQPFTLTVAQHHNHGQHQASGKVFWDDGETLAVGEQATCVMWTLTNTTLKAHVNGTYPITPTLERVMILGVHDLTYTVTVNGHCHEAQHYCPHKEALVIENLTLSMNQDFIISWNSTYTPSPASDTSLSKGKIVAIVLLSISGFVGLFFATYYGIPYCTRRRSTQTQTQTVNKDAYQALPNESAVNAPVATAPATTTAGGNNNQV
eukprot:TRINITY_DN3317_c0_g1_i1.p1 TRINITY_DN3317_c0_g1~~TRINITY_DN3317_c0_g1_i1.p1  ORF type:complete len:931 (-),score=217.82 TRINITY_DN3317_c0_g1_i1:148-2913(-)